MLGLFGRTPASLATPSVASEVSIHTNCTYHFISISLYSHLVMPPTLGSSLRLAVLTKLERLTPSISRLRPIGITKSPKKNSTPISINTPKLCNRAYTPPKSNTSPLRIGDIEIPCYVLADGRRVLAQRGLQGGVGLSRSGGKPGARRLTSFLTSLDAKGIDTGDLIARVNEPILFIPPHGAALQVAAQQRRGSNPLRPTPFIDPNPHLIPLSTALVIL